MIAAFFPLAAALCPLLGGLALLKLMFCAKTQPQTATRDTCQEALLS